jgi:predicted DNA-binding protein
MPKKPIEYPIAITVRLGKDTVEILNALAKADRRPVATVARILIEVVCQSMGDRALHEIIAAHPPSPPVGRGRKL